MRVLNRLWFGVASFAVASLPLAVPQPIASADECGSGYMFDQTGQCVPAPQQGQDQAASETDAQAGLPPNLSADACSAGYTFDKSGACVSTSTSPPLTGGLPHAVTSTNPYIPFPCEDLQFGCPTSNGPFGDQGIG